MHDGAFAAKLGQKLVWVQGPLFAAPPSPLQPAGGESNHNVEARKETRTRHTHTHTHTQTNTKKSTHTKNIHQQKNTKKHANTHEHKNMQKHTHTHTPWFSPSPALVKEAMLCEVDEFSFWDPDLGRCRMPPPPIRLSLLFWFSSSSMFFVRKAG